METVYTVSESVGSVEVCVNLTRPQVDILDEFVIVEVTDYPTSAYIPANAPLESGQAYYALLHTLIIIILQLLIGLTSLAYILWHQ